MLPLLLPISALLSGVALLLLGNGLLNTLLTLRGVAEGYSTGLLGLVMSGYFVGFFLGIWIGTPLIRRIGHIRAFAFCAAVAASSALLHTLFINLQLWLALRVIYGIALVTLYTVVESWLNTQTSNDQRGRVFAIYMAVNLGSLALAQPLINLAEPQTFTLFALASILISCALLPITFTRQAQPNIPDTPHSDLRYLAQIAPLAMVTAGLSGLALGAFWGLGPVYAYLSGFDAAGVGWLMSSAILGGALLQWPIGRYSDTHDRRLVLTWVVILCVGLALLMALLPAGSWLLATIFVWGGLAFALYPLAVAQLIDQLHADEVLSGSSGLLMVNGIGSMLGPMLAGQLMQLLGPRGLPLYFALILALLAGYVIYRRRHVSDLVSEPHGHFIPMLRTSHSVLALMPDAPTSDNPPPNDPNDPLPTLERSY